MSEFRLVVRRFVLKAYGCWASVCARSPERMLLVVGLAENRGETLNPLFDVLADWNHQLKHAKIDIGELRP